MTKAPPADDRSGGKRKGADRRDKASRRALRRRIRLEYAEMPGLCLTVPQARRLFALREDICCRVLNELVRTTYLGRDMKGAYRRNAGRP